MRAMARSDQSARAGLPWNPSFLRRKVVHGYSEQFLYSTGKKTATFSGLLFSLEPNFSQISLPLYPATYRQTAVETAQPHSQEGY